MDKVNDMKKMKRRVEQSTSMHIATTAVKFINCIAYK